MSGVNVNELPRPRVLIWMQRTSLLPKTDFVKTLIETVRVVNDISDIDASEWDAIVTDVQPSWWTVGTRRVTRTRSVPEGLYVFYLQPEETQHGDIVIDFDSSDDGRPLLALRRKGKVPGNRAHRVSGLPDEIAALTQQVLEPLVAARSRQFGFVPEPQESVELPPDYCPFLHGPDELVYAGTYRRTLNSLVWVVPQDLSDFQPWFELALRAWHDDDPTRFPGAPRWVEDLNWYTAAEMSARSAISAEEEAFRPLQEAHEAAMARLTVSLEELRSQSAATDRILLTGQDEPLQNEARLALEELGFQVQDMDTIWNDRERREDFRVSDTDEPDWMAIADATGTSKGVKGTKLVTLGRYVTKYLAENPGSPVPNQWLIANQFIERDPSARPASLLRGDELLAFAEADGLAVDTVALFIVVQAVRANQSLKVPVRAHLRSLRGEFTARDARAWLAAQSS